jgi:hypothetical protein
MKTSYINAGKLIGLNEFLANPQNIADASGTSSLLVLHDNKPAFYVLNLQSWNVICSQLGQAPVQGLELTGVNSVAIQLPETQLGPARLAQIVQRVSDLGAFEKRTISQRWPIRCWI